MHPALSVIFFTALSGTGYGLLFLLALGLGFDPLLVGRNEALVVLATGAMFAAAGLTSSLFHLGQPQRAWRALSQWRSSWLSREGVAAIASFIPLLALGVAIWRGSDAAVLRTTSGLLAVMSVFTVCCTAKIYTSLKTIHAWHNRYVLPGYLLLALSGGSAWLLALHELLAPANADASLAHGLARLVVAVCVIGYVWKRAYWQFIDTSRHPATAESATGLGRFGSVRSVEAPHTEENYLTREMGFALARKHAARLRSICLILIGPLPAVLAFGVLVTTTQSPVPGVICTLAAAAAATAGTFVERWLFFAEAKHVVMLYYGAARAWT